MLIQEIKMTNFRQYKGEVTITFSTEVTKNVTMIMGNNGSGKTTLAQAFKWVLYGKNDFKIKELLNRDVRDKMLKGDRRYVKVELVVQDDTGKHYKVIRRWEYVAGAGTIRVDKENFTVRYKKEDGQMTDMAEKPSKIFVKKMLPEDLSQFFIFDGERIEKMSKEINDGKSQEFAEAVHSLIGLVGMRNAINNFAPNRQYTVTGHYKKALNESAGEKADKYIKEIERLEGELEKTKKELEEKQKQIPTYEELALENKKKLEDMAPQVQLKEDYRRMESKLSSEEKQKYVKINALMRQFNTNAVYDVSQPLYQAALTELKETKHLEKGIPGLRSDTLNYLLKRQECLCGERLEAGDPHYRALQELLNYAAPKSVGQMIIDYKKDILEVVKHAEGFEKEVQMRIRDISESDQTIERLHEDMRKTEELMANTDDAKIFKKQKDENQKMAESLRQECMKLMEKMAEDNMQLGYQKKERNKLILQIESNKKNRRYYEYAKYIYEMLVKEYAQKETTTRKDLEHAINEVFQEIYDGGIQLEVDEHYKLHVIVSEVLSSGDELERNTAQNYAIIFAFISGIIKLAKENKKKDAIEMGLDEEEVRQEYDGYPLIMDAPLSAFDKKRIKGICETIPTIAKQVIIFIKDTDGDIAKEYMKERIGKTCMLIADSQTATHIEEV